MKENELIKINDKNIKENIHVLNAFCVKPYLFDNEFDKKQKELTGHKRILLKMNNIVAIQRKKRKKEIQKNKINKLKDNIINNNDNNIKPIYKYKGYGNSDAVYMKKKKGKLNSSKNKKDKNTK